MQKGLVLPSWGSGWPCLLGVRVLAFPSWGEGWPSLLGPVRLSHLLGVGGFAIPSLSGGWPFLDLALGVMAGPAFSEWVGPPFSGLVFGHSFLVGGWLALSSRGWGFGPCPSFFGGCLPFLLGLSVRHSFLEWRLALLGVALQDESWPCVLVVVVGLSFSRWRVGNSFSWCGLALPSWGWPSLHGTCVWPVLLVLGL